jgi:hypothetical protein
VVIPKTKKLMVWLHAERLAAFERVARDDPRMTWIREQAAVCVAEGMAPGEAVQLAADLAFRRYGVARRGAG